MCIFVGVLFGWQFLISYARNTVKKLHFPEQFYQSNRIKASVNNEANQKISGDSRCLITEATSMCVHRGTTNTTPSSLSPAAPLQP